MQHLAPTIRPPNPASRRASNGRCAGALGVRASHGFSLLELLLVMLVLGIVVGMAIPRYHQYKRRYYLSTMVSDLRNLATTQEAYWNFARTYSTDLQHIDFNSSPHVSISMVSADTLGWAAKATYAGDSVVCALYYGNAPVLPPATVKNVIGCTP